MCTRRNAAAASQEIIKAGWDVGSKKGAFLRLMAMAAAVCGMSVSDSRRARVARVPRQQPLYGQSRGVIR